VQFANDEARAAFAAAITKIETESACEAVITIRRQSAIYLHTHAIVGTIALFAALAFGLYSEAEFSTLTILLEPFVVAAVFVIAMEWLPALKRALTPRSWRITAVQRAARATFYEHGIGRTTGRTGILFYISWQERIVAVVPDISVAAAIKRELITKLERDMSNSIGQGGVAVAAIMAAFATNCAVLEHGDEDLNELPDAIDSHFSRRAHQVNRGGAV
jgi:putative membrane protein